jgi:hypothetical protein
MNTCGLSQREAAEFHGVRIDTVKSWCGGRNRAPDGAIDELRKLFEKIDRAADNLIDTVDEISDKIGVAEEIEVGYASDDAEAQSLGWPCVGAQLASIGLAAAYIEKRLRLVPRGSTEVTAAAADAHDAGPI